MLLFLLQVIPLSQALPWDGPTETLGLQFNPAPVAQVTEAPIANLNRRQEQGDSTCGFYNHTSPGLIYCGGGTTNVCATDSNNGWGCCSATALDGNCALATTCIDSTAITLFNATYFSNPFVGYCDTATLGYCVTWYLEANDDQYTQYACDSYRYSYSYYTTYSVNGTAGTYTASFSNAYYDAPARTTTSTTPSTTSTSSKISSSTTSSTTTSVSPTQTSSVPAPASHVGAIAGGAAGGVAALFIAGIALFCCLRSHKKKKQRSMEQDRPPAAPYGMEHQQQQHWQGSPPIAMTHHQHSTYDGGPASHQTPYVAEGLSKQPPSPYASQVTSPTLSGAKSGPLSHTTEGNYERQSTVGSQFTAVDDPNSLRHGDAAELDGRIYRDYERY